MAEPLQNGHDTRPEGAEEFYNRVVYGREPLSNGVDREAGLYERYGPLANGHDPGHEPLHRSLSTDERMEALTRAIREEGQQLRATIAREAADNRYQLQSGLGYVGWRTEQVGNQLKQMNERLDQMNQRSFWDEMSDSRPLVARMFEDMGNNLRMATNKSASKQGVLDRTWRSGETRWVNGQLASRHRHGLLGVGESGAEKADWKALKAEYKADQKAMRDGWKQERKSLSILEKYGPGSGRHKEAFERDWRSARMAETDTGIRDKLGPEQSRTQANDLEHGR